MNLMADRIGFQTLIGCCTDKYPVAHGNCFGLVVGEDEYRIVNFYLENLEYGLKRKLITWPISIRVLRNRTAVIDDDRIDPSFYQSDYCQVCCPRDLWTEPQRDEYGRQVSRGEVTVKVCPPDDKGTVFAIEKHDRRKCPVWIKPKPVKPLGLKYVQMTEDQLTVDPVDKETEAALREAVLAEDSNVMLGVLTEMGPPITIGKVSGRCGCGSKKYGANHRPEDHAGWKPE